MLIDQGSQLSFISEELVRSARLKRVAASIPLLGIGGTYSGRTRGIVTVNLHSTHNPGTGCMMKAHILPRLTTKLPPYSSTVKSWPHIEGLQLAVSNFAQSGSIHIIIGSDNYGSIILPGLKRDDPSSPVAQQTIFGWVLSGNTSEKEVCNTTQSYHCKQDQELQNLIVRFWRQEELPNSKTPRLSEEEEKCEKHFMSTHTRDADGRYRVRLPLRLQPTLLGDSKKTALRALYRLTGKFTSDKTFENLYNEFIQEYKSMGHMIKVRTPHEEGLTAYYLPHLGVLREQSQTTKLRVVFNGSSRTNSGYSLNDLLYAGNKLQTEISEVLTWIRTHKILFSTDITKMFRQIAVHKDDWNLQRILWREIDGKINTYQLTTVTYGLNCAPFLALRTLQQLIADEGQRFPKAMTPLTKGRYVDDIFGGAETITEAKEIIKQLIQLCDAGKFPLQKWTSNKREVLPESSEEQPSTIDIEPTPYKILGLQWKPEKDTFHFSAVKQKETSKITKRKIASEIAQLYDPLGLITPVLVRAKFILQELWLLKASWDDSLPQDLEQRWNGFRQQLQHLEELSIPRWLGNINSDSAVEIHGFSDASQLAMSAVIYIRTPKENEKYKSRLVCSKTRVAPIKRLTIPRLELTAALILAKLMKNTQQTLELNNATLNCWSDSTVALTWITSHPARWKDFVHNRVSAIHEVMPTGTWRHVPSKENPADCASRGLTPSQLAQHALWWKGPSWLSQTKTSWPVSGFTLSEEATLEERPRSIMVAIRNEPSYWEVLHRYSSLTKLLRVTATCRRFVAYLKREPASSLRKQPLTPMELEWSRKYWIKAVQQAYFPSEIRMISNGTLPKANSLVRLIPFLDKEGLLRVGGRLHHAQVDTEIKHPYILPRKSTLSKLIINEAHKKVLHGGTQATLSYIRRSYWIIGGRAPVRSEILKCVLCARYRGKRAEQLMGQLPPARVTPARTFYNTGLDYAGPLSLKTWKGRAARTYKGYLAIFVCLATSAIHIEVVTDYTTDAFIAAYKRFTGRRGICATLQSDCGTNFIGADAELRRQFKASSEALKDIITILANDRTQWKFNPPSAPHFGGKWEAAVKSTKYHLYRILKDTILTYEEMTTVTVQIEAVLNSRPLCPLSDDATDYTPLTPGHFLIGETPTAIPEPNLQDEKTTRLSRWQILRQKVDQFWTRWSSECLQRYQAISKWHYPSNTIKDQTG